MMNQNPTAASNAQNYGMAAGIGGLGAGLAGLLGGGAQNPYDSASQYYNQIPGYLKQYLNPYMQAGQGAMGQLQGQYGQLINDPTAMMNKIGAGYQQSPGFNWQMQQAMGAANNAAAAGGMAGSPQHQQQAQTVATGLANQDYYNYMDKGLSQYGMGLQGLQGINAMGYGASNSMAQGMAGSLMNQGNLAYSGQASQNQAQGQMYGDIFGGLGALASFGGFL